MSCLNLDLPDLMFAEHLRDKAAANSALAKAGAGQSNIGYSSLIGFGPGRTAMIWLFVVNFNNIFSVKQRFRADEL